MKAIAVKNTGLSAADQHSPEPKLTNDFIERSFAYKKLLSDISETIEGRPSQCEKIALKLIAATDASRSAALGDVVRAEEDANTTDANQDTHNLCPMVANVEDDKRYNDNNDNRPEIDELCRKYGCVSISENREVITLHVEEGEYQILPAISSEDNIEITLEAILVH